MKISYLATECYPAAKVGGLADVMGALPKYLDADVEVVIPKYDLPWFKNQAYDTVYERLFVQNGNQYTAQILEVKGQPLGFPMFLIHIPGLFDRAGVYADESGHFFQDETERYVAFQHTYIDWLHTRHQKPDIVHTHDHHTGLVPFMMKYCYAYASLKSISTVFTIHNQRYQGIFDWGKQYLIPDFDPWKSGLLDWNHQINPLASGVKCADRVTTVSPSYMEELTYNSFGLEWLFNEERKKSVGIINGIDHDTWNPKTDPLIEIPLKRSVGKFKRENKDILLAGTPLNPQLPLISFIGRFAGEKGADLIPSYIHMAFERGLETNFFILGSGDKKMENELLELQNQYPKNVKVVIAYNEKLAHQIYAGTDMILMPSRVEPCGLNQMYALRYGTIPLVHKIGGLKDTIKDTRSGTGNGYTFEDLKPPTVLATIEAAINLFDNHDEWNTLISIAIQEDFSWNRSASAYMDLYKSILEP